MRNLGEGNSGWGKRLLYLASAAESSTEPHGLPQGTYLCWRPEAVADRTTNLALVAASLLALGLAVRR